MGKFRFSVDGAGFSILWLGSDFFDLCDYSPYTDTIERVLLYLFVDAVVFHISFFLGCGVSGFSSPTDIFLS